MNILVIGAHPDDLEFGCGGTLLKFLKQGQKINLLVLTDGSYGGSNKIRKREQLNSAKFLKANLFWGGYKDTSLPLDKRLIDSIESVIKKTKADLIFIHYFEDTHQDHRIASSATISATRYIRNVLFYEVPTTINFSPGVFVDIGSVMKEKIKLLKIHRSQVYQTRVEQLSILESAKSTAIFRGYQNRVKFAEGFVPLRLSLEVPKGTIR